MDQEAKIKLMQKMIDAGVSPEIRNISEDSACIEIPMYEKTTISGASLVFSPFDCTLPLEQRVNNIISASQVVMDIVTYILHKSYELPIFEHQTKELLSVANAMLQRSASFHASNIKLTQEGITANLGEIKVEVPDDYKTIPLTRSVYEHLAMFYYIFERPFIEGEKDIVWKLWKIAGLKNQISHNKEFKSNIKNIKNRIHSLTDEILSTPLGKKYKNPISNYLTNANINGSVRFITDEHGNPQLERLSYSGALKELSSQCDTNYNFTLLYRLLSLHCHPTYVGLSHFMNQAKDEDPFTGMALHFSSAFLARLCKYYIHQFQEGTFDMQEHFTPYALGILDAYSKLF